jgi:phosphoribosyl 1,2-cyclic phosphodiesterase
MRLCSLASGSSGNSFFVDTGRTRILVDAGITLRQLNLRLRGLGVSISGIDAVVVSHEHTDHTAAIPYLEIPVYVSSLTIDMWKNSVSNLKVFESGVPFYIKDLLVLPFSIPHDALDPVGFSLQTDTNKKVGIVTDIGSVTNLVRERLKDSNVLVLEFNYDESLILYSHYPWELKQRIRSRLGHLSNGEAGNLLKSLVHSGLYHVVLAHLSEVNNKPELALNTAYSALFDKGAKDIRLSVAPRKRLGEVIEI